MMTSTHFNAWLLSIELGTGVVIGQHFQARCAETCERIPNHHQNWRKKRFRERAFIRAFVCTKHTQTLSLLRVFVLSSFVFYFWQLVYGVPLDDWYPSCGLPKVLFTIAYSERQRQILRLARIFLRFRIHTTIFLTFSLSLFCVCFLLLRGGGKKKEKKKKMLMMMKRRAHDDCIYFFREEVICPY